MTARQYKDFDINPLLECGATQEVEDKTQYFTPTQLGRELKLSPSDTNKFLEQAGLQVEKRDTKNRKAWQVTEAGKPFCLIIDTDKRHGSGAPIAQIKWSMAVLDYAWDILDNASKEKEAQSA